MKVENVNPIIEAVYSVGGSFLKNKPVIGKPFVSKKVKLDNGLLISIAIHGDFNGRCFLAFNNNSIKIIAGSMIGAEINEIDDMVESAISEFCNMVMGNAATNYSTINMYVDISSPMAMKNSNYISNDINFLGLPFCLSNENNFNLFFVEK